MKQMWQWYWDKNITHVNKRNKYVIPVDAWLDLVTLDLASAVFLEKKNTSSWKGYRINISDRQ